MNCSTEESDQSIGVIFLILIAMLFFIAITAICASVKGSPSVQRYDCDYKKSYNYKQSQEQYGTCTLTPIDCRITKPHEGIATDYEYTYDWFNGKVVKMPNVHSDTISEKYEVLYKIEPKRHPSPTDDGITEEWHEVTKEEYEEALNTLNK